MTTSLDAATEDRDAADLDAEDLDAADRGEGDGNSVRSKKKTPRPPPCIGFDMGGTSTDVSRYDGVFEQVTETETAGVAIQAPQLDITTVAAGAGRRFRSAAGRSGSAPSPSARSPARCATAKAASASP